jgi:hypothetical protein
MVISNSYVKLPEGKPHSMKTKKMRPQILEFDVFDVFFWILSKKMGRKGYLGW